MPCNSIPGLWTDLAAGGAALEARGVAGDRDGAARAAPIGSSAESQGLYQHSTTIHTTASRLTDLPPRDTTVVGVPLTCEVVGGHLVHVVPKAGVHLDQLLRAHRLHVRRSELRLQSVLVRCLLRSLEERVSAEAIVVLARFRVVSASTAQQPVSRQANPSHVHIP